MKIYKQQIFAICAVLYALALANGNEEFLSDEQRELFSTTITSDPRSCKLTCIDQGQQFCASPQYAQGYCCDKNYNCNQGAECSTQLPAATINSNLKYFPCPYASKCGGSKLITVTNSTSTLQYNRAAGSMTTGDVCGFRLTASNTSAANTIIITFKTLSGAQAFLYSGGSTYETATKQQLVDLNSNGGRYEFNANFFVYIIIVNFDPIISPNYVITHELNKQLEEPVTPPPPKTDIGLVQYVKDSDSAPIIIGIAVGLVIVLVAIIIILIILVRRYVRKNRMVPMKKAGFNNQQKSTGNNDSTLDSSQIEQQQKQPKMLQCILCVCVCFVPKMPIYDDSQNQKEIDSSRIGLQEGVPVEDKYSFPQGPNDQDQLFQANRHSIINPNFSKENDLNEDDQIAIEPSTRTSNQIGQSPQIANTNIKILQSSQQSDRTADSASATLGRVGSQIDGLTPLVTLNIFSPSIVSSNAGGGQQQHFSKGIDPILEDIETISQGDEILKDLKNHQTINQDDQRTLSMTGKVEGNSSKMLQYDPGSVRNQNQKVNFGGFINGLMEQENLNERMNSNSQMGVISDNRTRSKKFNEDNPNMLHSLSDEEFDRSEELKDAINDFDQSDRMVNQSNMRNLVSYSLVEKSYNTNLILEDENGSSQDDGSATNKHLRKSGHEYQEYDDYGNQVDIDNSSRGGQNLDSSLDFRMRNTQTMNLLQKMSKGVKKQLKKQVTQSIPKELPKSQKWIKNGAGSKMF
eukprot:403344659